LNGKVDKVGIEQDIIRWAELCVVVEEQRGRNLGPERPWSFVWGWGWGNWGRKTYTVLTSSSSLAFFFSSSFFCLFCLQEGRKRLNQQALKIVLDAIFTYTRASLGLIIRLTSANFLVFLILPMVPPRAIGSPLIHRIKKKLRRVLTEGEN